MVLTAGVITQQSVGYNSAQLISTSATGGTGPYTQQWYRSTTTGFVPGAGNILAGQTGLTLSDSGLIPNTVYFYKVVYTDAVAATVTSSQYATTTTPASQGINQFAMASFLGMIDLKVGNTNVTAGQVDVTQSGLLYGGSAVKVIDGPNGIPTIVACTADTDNVWGFIVYDIKSQAYAIGSRCEIAQQGSCIWLFATTAIARGSQVVLDLTSSGAVQAATGVDTIVGYAFDQATAYGQLIRVILTTPSFLAN
jgi:hypothetical protein